MLWPIIRRLFGLTPTFLALSDWEWGTGFMKLGNIDKARYVRGVSEGGREGWRGRGDIEVVLIS